MTYDIARFWIWLLLAFCVGIPTGWFTWSRTQRTGPLDGWLGGWLSWMAFAVVLGFLIAITRLLPGLPGLWLETALLLLASYVVGCLLGGSLRGLVVGSESVATYARGTSGLFFRPQPGWIDIEGRRFGRERGAMSPTERLFVSPPQFAGDDEDTEERVGAAPTETTIVPLLSAAPIAPAALIESPTDDALGTPAAAVIEDPILSASLAPVSARLDRPEAASEPAAALSPAIGTTAKGWSSDDLDSERLRTPIEARPIAETETSPSPPPSQAPPVPATASGAVEIHPTYPGEKPSASGSADGSADDLKLIKGIGPKNARACNALGIDRFRQIAEWTPANAIWVGHHIAFPGRIEREHWIPQAKLLASGIETTHAAGVKSGTIPIGDGADLPLTDAEATALAASLPKLAPSVEGEERHQGQRPLGLIEARGGTPDNLQLIKGIGPQNEGRLHALGIWHFAQIAAWNADNIRWAGSYLAFPGRIDRERWVVQAKDLAAGGAPMRKAGRPGVGLNPSSTK